MSCVSLSISHPSLSLFDLVACSCGAMLMAQKGKFEAMGTGYVRDEAGAQQEFSRMGDSGVIDVDAIDVDD